MAKFILNKEQIYNLISQNRYPVGSLNRFQSRCIDGRYENKESLAPLSIMGADVGELAILAAASNMYGFDVNLEKAYKELEKIVGGKKNISFHSDIAHTSSQSIGCGYINLLKENLPEFNLQKSQIDFLTDTIKTVEKNGSFEVLQGFHHEGAFLQIVGDYSIYPRYSVEMDGKEIVVEIFTFHRSLVNERHKEWVKQLVAKKAVKLYDKLDEEYLYEVLSNTTEEHMFETARRLGKGLPMYEVVFDQKDGFKVNDLGIL